MQSTGTAKTVQVQTGPLRQHSRRTYAKVFDERKRRMRGLWKRNGTFYAQLTLLDEGAGKKTVRRVRLEDENSSPVTTVAEAVKMMNKLKVRRDDDDLRLSPKR